MSASKDWRVLGLMGCLVGAFYLALRITVSFYSGTGYECWVGSGCEAVLTSPLASYRGVPTASLGVLLTLTLILLCVAGSPGSRVHIGTGRDGVFWGLILAGGTVWAGLQTYAAFGIGALCVLCLGFGCLLLGAVGFAVTGLSGDHAVPSPPPEAPKRLAYVTIAAGVALGHLSVAPINHLRATLLHPERLANTLHAEVFPAIATTIGEREDRSLVVFLDPDCLACAEAVPGLVEAGMSGRTSVTIRWFPKQAQARRTCAILLALSMEFGGAKVLSQAFGDMGCAESDAINVALGLGWNHARIRGAVGPDSVWMRGVDRDKRFGVRVGVAGTPAYVGFESGQYRLLSGKQISAWLALREPRRAP